jgi:uncharacterized protein YbjT (DUF2867 family)
VQAPYDDRASLSKAAAGVDGVFMLTTPVGGIENEIEQGFVQASAYADAKVPHIVFSSVGSANLKTGIPHFESKFRVEQQLAVSGTLGIAMPAGTSLQMQSVSDIGEFAASLFERRSDVIGKRFDLAADEVSGTEMADILGRITGKQVVFQELSPDMFRPQMEDMALMFEWFERVGYIADITQLRAKFQDVPRTRFEDWAKSQKWN